MRHFEDPWWVYEYLYQHDKITGWFLDSSNLQYVPITKTGSSTMVQLLNNIDNYFNNRSNDFFQRMQFLNIYNIDQFYWLFLERQELKQNRINYYKRVSQLDGLARPLTFTIVRDPFTRLVSGYVAKFVRSNETKMENMTKVNWNTREKVLRFLGIVRYKTWKRLKIHFQFEITFPLNQPGEVWLHAHSEGHLQLRD